MSSNFRTRISRSRSPEDDYSKRSLLAKVNKSELTKLQVAIKRVGLIAVGPNGPLQRGIDDRAKICAHVHVRKGRAPRMPIFSGDIKVNQDFSEDRTVFTHDKYHKPQKRSRSRSKGDHDRSRSRDRNHKERRRSKTSDRSRSRGRIRRRSSSRTRRSPSKYRSRSRERRYSLERSKSRSRSGSSNRYRRRSITPLRPGEYRPGHPDLALRSTNRKSRSKSRSPRNSSRGDNSTSTSRDRVSPGRSRSRRTPSPYSRERRRSRSRHRSPPMQMPKMDYGFYEGFPPMSMNPMFPFRGRFPMVQPGFYPRMYHPNMMMGPRLPMMPRMPRIPIPRRLNIMDNAAKKNAAIKPATITSTKDEKDVIIEHVDEADNNEAVSSSNKHGDSVEISH